MSPLEELNDPKGATGIPRVVMGDSWTMTDPPPAAIQDIDVENDDEDYPVDYSIELTDNRNGSACYRIYGGRLPKDRADLAAILRAIAADVEALDPEAPSTGYVSGFVETKS